MTLDDVEQREQLENERTRGSHATQAYEDFIHPFLIQKRNDLFIGFQNCSVTEVDSLVEIKRMSMALDALEAEIVNVINTGKMASQELNKVPMDKH